MDTQPTVDDVAIENLLVSTGGRLSAAGVDLQPLPKGEQAGLLQVAKSNIEAGKYENARALLVALLLSNPECAEGYNMLGVMLGAQLKFSLAIQALSRAIELDEASVIFRYNRAMAWVSINRIRDAVTDFAAVLKLDPNVTTQHGKLAQGVLEKFIRLAEGQNHAKAATRPAR